MAALDDRALIAEVRSGDPRAWSEFLERFRGPLEHFARAVRIPNAHWPECVQDVLEEALMQLSEPSTPVPRVLIGYLMRMSRNRYINIRRDAKVTEHYAEIAESPGAEPVLRCLLSEASHRASAQDVVSEDATSVRALESVTIRLRTALNAADQELLVWVEHRIAYRDIAEWLGTSYAVTAKRIWRLQRRLRDLAERCRDAATPEEQREIDRFMKRVATRTRSKDSLNERESNTTDDGGIDGVVDPERS